MKLNVKVTRDYLQQFKFVELFNELGWNRPQRAAITQTVRTLTYTQVQVAELGGVRVFEIQTSDGKMPTKQERQSIYRNVVPLNSETLLIFVDNLRTQSVWRWERRENDKVYPFEHTYFKGQPGDLSLSKLGKIVFDISDFNEKGNVPVTDVAKRLRNALDVEQVSKRFYADFKETHDAVLDEIEGIDDERDRRWYASIILNRLMFIYFLQRKLFIDNGEDEYLQKKLADSKLRGADRYYEDFLKLLFFEGFAKPEEERSESAKKRLGKIVYLNGGLFLVHPIEKKWPNIKIPDHSFDQIFALFTKYSWNLDDAPEGKDDEISPHVLGYIFEKYINQKSFGAYYTRPEITEYLCEQTIDKLVLDKIAMASIPGRPARKFNDINEMLINLDAQLCRDLLRELPKISLLDPACGSGAFLVSSMNTLTKIYGAITGKIEYLRDEYLANWLKNARAEHGSLEYSIKRKIITENLFGVDVMEEATEIAKLRLFLALVSAVRTVDQLEPLPNIDFNILPGNSLIGLLQVNEDIYNKQVKQLNMFQKPYANVVREKNLLIKNYKNIRTYTKDLRALRDNILSKREEAIGNLNEIMLDTFRDLGVKYDETIWYESRQQEGKGKRRSLRIEDINLLHPFHWGYEFDEVMNERGGFDIIITNPPWEILKPQAKEFFATHSKLVTKNKMRIEDFEREQEKLLQDKEVREQWLKYQNSFPYQSAYFRAAPQYSNQVSIVNDKKAGTDINLYKLFVEQCYNLLRDGGQCGIVLPSGIYTDLGAKQLRELLFEQTQITGLFGFENRKNIFEGVDSRFKFVVLTYEKGGSTQQFPTAFMRQEAAELDQFPREGALPLSVELIRRLSPDSLSIMEFKSEMDVENIGKMLEAPLLGITPKNNWYFALTNELHMTNDSHLFSATQQDDAVPLYEGKMIHQYNHFFSQPRYWINVKSGREMLLRQEKKRVEIALDSIAILQLEDNIKNIVEREERVKKFLAALDYSALTLSDVRIDQDAPRLAFRDIASNTNERTLISAILPSHVFAGNTLNYIKPWHFDASKILERPASIKDCYTVTFSSAQLAYLCGIFNSFMLDYMIRFKVTTHVNMFYMYQLPVPRIDQSNPYYGAIVSRVAKLVCIGPEFDEMRRELLGNVGAHVAVDAEERLQLRSEVDGLIAHLYNFTEVEYKRVLSTFPLVNQRIKDEALAAYTQFAGPGEDLQLAELIAKGESRTVEFKVAACYNPVVNRKDDSMRENITIAVASFLNSRDGGTLLIGVDNAGNVVGLSDDYSAANQQKNNRDGYELFLSDLIKDNLHGYWGPFYTISFGTVQGKDICRIDIQPANGPVFIKSRDDKKNGNFYTRVDNRKRLLSSYDFETYRKDRWP